MGLHLISPSQNIIPVAFEIRLANYSCGGSSGFKKIHQIPVLISDKSENPTIISLSYSITIVK
tara:strand:+ start:171 stop:359 length:189 start_codon:yes stop_codon:yes gene_type:complete